MAKNKLRHFFFYFLIVGAYVSVGPPQEPTFFLFFLQGCYDISNQNTCFLTLNKIIGNISLFIFYMHQQVSGHIPFLNISP